MNEDRRRGSQRLTVSDPASRARCSVVALLAVLLLVVPAFANEPSRPVAGMPLSDALALLQQQGLRIAFSSALVHPEMVVEEDPEAQELRAMLEEILAPHGLAVYQGPGEQLVVVQARPVDMEAGSIRGQLHTDGDRTLLRGVRVVVVETGLQVLAADDGRFVIESLPAGEYTLRTESPAFLGQGITGLRVRPGETTTVRFQLVPAEIFLNEIIVTPSHFRILDEQPESRQFLTRDEVAQMPHVADDLYRAVKRLPGASGGDISARFHVRGGATDEVLVILDGLELYEPFHLKDFQAIFSTVDAEAVGGVDFLTGGYPVEYGDRMSGVMDISIATPTGPPSTSVGITTLNTRFLSEGMFHEGRGSWMVSGRGWYPDVVFEAARSSADEILSDYYDLLAKVEHRVGGRSTLAADLLLAYDDLSYRTEDEEETEQVRARYRSHHLWLNLRTEWSDRLFSQTVLSSGDVHRDRTGAVDDEEEGTLDVKDTRDFDFIGLKQDWTFQANDSHLVKWGVDVKRQRAEYDYWTLNVVIDPDVIGDGEPLVDEIDVDLMPKGESYGMYLADRFRIGASLIAELGLRWDKQFWADDQQISPRVNLRYSVGANTALRMAWGRYHQSQRLNELQVEDGVSRFYPAQLAEHWLASLEHRYPSGLAVRLEAYHKKLEELQPRFENVLNPLELFYEAQQDRVRIAPERGRAEGVELLVKQDGGERVTWWISYGWGRAEDEINGEMVPRSWDQRHAASFGLNLSLPRGWNVNLAGTYHSGWPTTDATGEVVGEEDGEPVVEITLGPRNRARFPHYRRFDVRASKRFTTARGEISLILEVINLTDRKNICCVDDFLWEVNDDGTVEVIREESTWAPIVPSLGVRWQF